MRSITAFLKGIVIGWVFIAGYFMVLWTSGFQVAYVTSARLLVMTQRVYYTLVPRAEQQRAFSSWQIFHAHTLKTLTALSAALPAIADPFSRETFSLKADDNKQKQGFDQALGTIKPEVQLFLGRLFLLLMNATILIFIKSLLFLRWSPLFLLAILVGLSEGLMKRAIRRANLGRESAYVFHKLLRYFPRFLLLITVLFMTLPFFKAIDALPIVFAFCLCLWVAQASARFKKYV